MAATDLNPALYAVQLSFDILKSNKTLQLLGHLPVCCLATQLQALRRVN